MEKVVTRQLFRNLERFEHQSIELNGWVRNNRAQKSFGFLMINDGSFFETIQVVYEESLDNFKEIQKIRVGSAVTVYGVVTYAKCQTTFRD